MTPVSLLLLKMSGSDSQYFICFSQHEINGYRYRFINLYFSTLLIIYYQQQKYNHQTKMGVCGSTIAQKLDKDIKYKQEYSKWEQIGCGDNEDDLDATGNKEMRWYFPLVDFDSYQPSHFKNTCLYYTLRKERDLDYLSIIQDN